MGKNTNAAAKAAPAATEAKAQAADPFADVPVVKTEDGVELQDFSEVKGNEPFKYADVHSRATAAKAPMLLNYKHGQSVLIPGTNKKEFKAGSVYGTIQALVNSAGRSGIPVYQLITQLRREQIGNKRSKYCNALPPIGWAEGWLNTAITKNIVGIHPTKTAAHFAPKEAEPEAEEQKKVAAK